MSRDLESVFVAPAASSQESSKPSTFLIAGLLFFVSPIAIKPIAFLTPTLSESGIINYSSLKI